MVTATAELNQAYVRRVVRGGSWSTFARDLRSTNRDADMAGERRNDSGFRVALRTPDAGATVSFVHLDRDRLGAFGDLKIGTTLLRFRWIPGGSFHMGTHDCGTWSCRNEGPEHLVTFDQGFWLAEHEVTRSLYREVMGDDPSHFADGDLQCPVESVSWLQAQEFCRRASALVPGVELALQTEAQREYAGRAGTRTPYCTGTTIGPDQANFDQHVGRPVPVKTYPPNDWGIYNAHGNVWEWTADAYHPTFHGAPGDGSAWGGDSGSDGLDADRPPSPPVLAQVEHYEAQDGDVVYSVVLQIGSKPARSVRLGVVDAEQAGRIADVINEGAVRLLDQ
jgi:formylglycine-generating enzyme required for sulfatase activity